MGLFLWYSMGRSYSRVKVSYEPNREIVKSLNGGSNFADRWEARTVEMVDGGRRERRKVDSACETKRQERS